MPDALQTIKSQILLRITNGCKAKGVHLTIIRYDLYTVTVFKMRRLNFNGSIRSPFENPPNLTHYKNTRNKLLERRRYLRCGMTTEFTTCEILGSCYWGTVGGALLTFIWRISRDVPLAFFPSLPSFFPALSLAIFSLTLHYLNAWNRLQDTWLEIWRSQVPNPLWLLATVVSLTSK